MNSATLIATVATTAAVIALPGTLELAQLTLGALLPERPRKAGPEKTVRLAVVIPAHDEQDTIGKCLDSLLAVNPPQGSFDIYVVADNCTDRTAAIARGLGVNVLERKDTSRRGKGYALEFAFNYLRRGYDAFIVLDADSVVPSGFVEPFRLAFSRGAQAVQSVYRVANPDQSRATRLMDLSLRAFNQVRPRGRQGWGQSVGLLGNGFALSRETLAKVPYTVNSVVEDLEYHLVLLNAGIKVEFLSGTHVAALMPTGGRASSTQRTRWEGGRLRMIREFAPRLLGRVLAGRLECIEPLLDLMLLPLSFHIVLLALAAAAGTGFTRAAGLAGIAVLIAHLAAAVAVGNSPLRDLRAIATIPLYIFWKITRLPMILAASMRGVAWVRTARTAEETV